MKRKFLTLLCFLSFLYNVTSICSDGNCYEEQDWQHIRDICKNDILPLLVDERSRNLFSHQFHSEICYAVLGNENAGKTTFVSTCINLGDLLPEFGTANTCVPVFVKKNSELTSPLLTDAYGNEISGDNIKSYIEEANLKCTKSPETLTKGDRFILQVPEFGGLDEMDTDRISFIDFGGMNTMDKKLSSALYEVFLSESDGVILMVTAAEVRSSNFHETLERMDFISQRPDFLSENFFIVVNRLEECTNGSREYRTLLNHNEPFSKEECVDLLQDLTAKVFDIYTENHPNFKMFSKDHIIVVGLADASTGLSGNEDLMERSNWNEFKSAIGPWLNEESYGLMKKRVFCENMLMLANRIIEDQQSKRDLSISNQENQAQQLQLLFDLKEKIETHSKQLDDEYQKILLNINTQSFVEKCPLQNIPERMIHINAVQGEIDTNCKECINNFREYEVNLKTTFLELNSSVNQWNLEISNDLQKTPSLETVEPLTSDSKLEYGDTSEKIDCKGTASSETRQIRSRDICGRHWHGGAQQCSRIFSRYDNAEEDKANFANIATRILSEEEKKLSSFVDSRQKVFETAKKQLEKEIDSLQQQKTINEEQQQQFQANINTIINVSSQVNRFKGNIPNMK